VPRLTAALVWYHDLVLKQNLTPSEFWKDFDDVFPLLQYFDDFAPREHRKIFTASFWTFLDEQRELVQQIHEESKAHDDQDDTEDDDLLQVIAQRNAIHERVKQGESIEDLRKEVPSPGLGNIAADQVDVEDPDSSFHFVSQTFMRGMYTSLLLWVLCVCVCVFLIIFH
jgi:hypothetical protein